MCLQAGLSTSRWLEVGKGGGTTHYRQAERLTPSSHHLAMASHGTAMCAGRAQGCLVPDLHPHLASSAAGSPPKAHVLRAGPSPPGLPVWPPEVLPSSVPGLRGGGLLEGVAAGRGCCRKGVLQEGGAPLGSDRCLRWEEAQWEEATFPLPNGENPYRTPRENNRTPLM